MYIVNTPILRKIRWYDKLESEGSYYEVCKDKDKGGETLKHKKSG